MYFLFFAIPVIFVNHKKTLTKSIDVHCTIYIIRFLDKHTSQKFINF